MLRVAKLGVKGVELSCSWNMTPMWHPMWDPLWAAIDETQLPLHFHTFPSVDPKLRAQTTGDAGLAMRYSSICMFQMTLGHILTALMGARFSSASLGSGWCSAKAGSAGFPI